MDTNKCPYCGLSYTSKDKRSEVIGYKPITGEPLVRCGNCKETYTYDISKKYS